MIPGLPSPWVLLAFAVTLGLSNLATGWKAYDLGHDAADAKWQTANAEMAEATTKALAKINADNLAALADLKAKQEAADQAVADQRAKYNRLGKLYDDLKKAAYNDQTPLSPSWNALFVGLRALTEANPDTGRPDRGRETINPSGPPTMRNPVP